jgi:hypothetical protein
MLATAKKTGYICQLIDCPDRTPECTGPGERIVTVQNFARLAPGMDVPLEGPVLTCPHCGRTGIEHRTDDGARLVVHVQTTELMSDGMVTEPQDVCRPTKS